MAKDIYTLHSTKAYHVNKLNTLGWELTICNALYPDETPLRRLLKRNDSFGHLLYDYLNQLLPLEKIKGVIEIGGGYGYLMKDFCDRNPSLKPVMLDISPFLLRKQKETLEGIDVSYREEDFLETDQAIIAGCDLAVLNENLGDFPALINLSGDIFQSPLKVVDPILEEVRWLFEKYRFSMSAGRTFNLNIGAIKAVEKLCVAGLPYIYSGEHSCEAVVPEALQSVIHIESTGDPERISLMGHDEYSIKFSYLQQVAQAFGYRTIRGSFADFIPVDLTERLLLVLATGGRHSDEDEMVCHFVEDLYKYEYIILIRTGTSDREAR